MSSPLKYLRAAFGVCLIIALTLYLDIDKVLEQLSQLHTVWLVGAALCIAASTILGGLNVYILLNRDIDLGFIGFLPIFWTAWAMSLVVPGQVGDIASVSMMLRRHQIEWHTSLGRSLVDKFISLSLTLILACVGLMLLNDKSLLASNVSLWFFAGCILVLVCVAVKWTKLWENLNPESRGILGLISRTLLDIRQTVRHHPMRIALNLALTICKIGLIGLAYWFVLGGLGYPSLSPMLVIPVVAASSLIAYLPISINGLGTVEMGGILMFASLGISSTAVLSAYLTLRVLVFILAWTPSGIWLLLQRQTASHSLS